MAFRLKIPIIQFYDSGKDGRRQKYDPLLCDFPMKTIENLHLWEDVGSFPMITGGIRRVNGATSGTR